MLRVRRLLIVFLLAGAGASSNAALAAPAHCTACGHPDYPPFMWQSGERIVGVGAAVLSELLAAQGVTLESRWVGNWKRCLAQLRRGQVDMVVSAYRTEDRESFLEYLPTALSPDYTSVFVWKERTFPFQRWEDLLGRQMVSMFGDSHGEEFDAFARARLQDYEVNSTGQAFRLLELGRVDFLPGGLLPWLIRIEVHGYAGRIVPLDTPLIEQGLFFAATRDSPCRRYLPEIDAGLQRMQASGEVERLFEDYRARYLREHQAQGNGALTD